MVTKTKKDISLGTELDAELFLFSKFISLSFSGVISESEHLIKSNGKVKINKNLIVNKKFVNGDKATNISLYENKSDSYL